MQKYCFLLTCIFSLIKSNSTIGQSFGTIETVLQKGHSRYVTCGAFSPDGKYIATGSSDNAIILWNAENGKEIRSFTMHTDFIRTVFFSSDGRHILSSSGDNRALITEITTGKVLTEIHVGKNRLFKACYSPDGSNILTMDDRNEIVVWDAVTGEAIGQYNKNYSADISSQWFTPDGNKIMTYSSYNEADLVDLTTGKTILKIPFDKPNTFAVSPDGKYVAIGSEKLFASIFNIETGELSHQLIDDKDKKCDGCNTLVTFSSDSRYVATAMPYTGVSVWNARNGERIINIPTGDKSIEDISLSPSNKFVIATVNNISYVWEVKTGKELFHFDNNSLKCIPVLSGDDNYLLTGNERNTAALWSINPEKSRPVKKIRAFEGYLNNTGNDGLKYQQDNWYHSNIIRFIRIKDGVSVHPNGKYLVKGKIDSVAVMIDLETGRIIRIFKGHSQAVLSTDFSSDGKWLLTAGGDGLIKIWDVETGSEIRSINAHNDLIFDAKFSSDSKYIVSGSWDGSCRIWNTTTGKIVRVINLENYSPVYVEFTPNDLYIITGDLAGKLKLWEVDAGKEFRDIIGHTDVVNSACFSPDGRIMVTASLDGKTKMWDLLSGMLINKFTDHTSGVYSVAYDPSSKFIVSGSNDRSIRIWDAVSGKEIKLLAGHSGGISSVNITPDGCRLISCTTDGEIKVWDLKNLVEIYTYIQIDRANWLAKTPSGYFDGSASALKLINYVSGLDVIEVNSLFEKYYSPGLLKRIREGEHFEQQTSSINTLIKNSPTITIELASGNTVDRLSDLDSIAWFRNSITLSIEVTDQGGGIDELRIYNDGKLFNNEKFDNNQRRAGRTQQKMVELPVLAGVNTISAVALDKDRVESMPATIKIYYDGIESDMNLYVISVGINKYQNPAYNLSFALDDAKAYTRLVREGAKNLFNTVEDHFIKDSDASKENIQAVFDQVAQKAGPGDVFIFYFAGHGAMSMSGEHETDNFYIIPYDVTNLYGDNEALGQKAISAEELLEMSKKIEARKQLYILDACQSGSALTAFNTRGASREKAIAQLARSTGTFFLLASGAVQYASEVKELGHGIFTYAILEALKGKADGGELDEKITANELKSYVEDRVPELTAEYMLTPQYPTGYGFGQDFPIVLVKE